MTKHLDRWSSAEKELLLKHWPNWETIQTLLPHRSEMAIKCKANALGRTVRERKGITIRPTHPLLLQQIVQAAIAKGYTSIVQLNSDAGIGESSLTRKIENPTLETLNALCSVVGMQLVLAPLSEKSNAPIPD